MASLTPFQEGIRLLSEGNTVEARRTLFAVWESGGSDAARAAGFVAHIDKGDRRFSNAISILESSLEKLGDSAPTLAQLAELYMTMGDHQKAIDAASRSLEEVPDNAVTALNLAIWRSNYTDSPSAIKTAFERWSDRHMPNIQLHTVSVWVERTDILQYMIME